MKITVNQVKENLIFNPETEESSFDFEEGGNNVCIDIYDGQIFVCASDKVYYTFSKTFTNLNHAVNSINLFFKD
jgi:hypothetical protein